MVRQQGKVVLTEDLFLDRLGAYSHYELRDVTYDPDRRTVTILMSGSGLPTVFEGQETEVVSPEGVFL